MCRQPLIVLKLGGSVLTCEESIGVAAHEIYRWRREGYRVVAVVSALAGATDTLHAQSRRIDEHAKPQAIAALVGLGELHNAALLGLYLDRAGVPACVLPPGALKLVAAGPPLDASPVDACTRAIRQGLDREGVVVVAGYVAEDAQGRRVVLGRGGSDLTALFLADRLEAERCRLIKDVDGLYDRDPVSPGPLARRYAQANWSDALATDGSIVQHKAVRFAESDGVAFELGCFNGATPTLIGDGAASFLDLTQRRRLRVSLLGLGTVGGGVYDALRRLETLVELSAVVVRDESKARTLGVPEELLSTQAESVVAADVDVVVEAIGGVDAAYGAVNAALCNGVHVVTANKRLIAERGEELQVLAASHGCRLLYSAAVGGSMPLLERLHDADGYGSVQAIRAILNGTTNFVLERIAAGHDIQVALAEARTLGYAEADASRDLDGRDAADKLCVLAREIGLSDLAPDAVWRDSLTSDVVATVREAVRNGCVVRQVASLRHTNGQTEASVRLLPIEEGDALFDVCGEQNAAVIERSDGSAEIVRGKGAGRWPTTEAVLSDVLEIARLAAGLGVDSTTRSKAVSPHCDTV